ACLPYRLLRIRRRPWLPKLKAVMAWFLPAFILKTEPLSPMMKYPSTQLMPLLQRKIIDFMNTGELTFKEYLRPYSGPLRREIFGEPQPFLNNWQETFIRR